eukprot:4747330-Pyramimonas_sp.AAC.1
MDGCLEGAQLDDGGLFGLEEAGWEPSAEEVEEAKKRKEHLAKIFKGAALQAFGPFREQAKDAINQQKVLNARLAAKRRRTEE